MARNSNTLPAGTTQDNMMKLVEIYKRKNTDAEAKPIFNMTDSVYSCTKSALRSLGLIKEKDCSFTDQGNDIAYSSDEEKREKMLSLLVRYIPYESLLSAIFLRGDVKETDVKYIVNHWGRSKHGSGLRNREDAASLFCSMMEYIGLGKFVKGKGGYVTRIEWGTDASRKFKDVLETVGGAPEENTDDTVDNNEEEYVEEQIAVAVETGEQAQTAEYNEPTVSVTPKVKTKATFAPNITINVDMSEWDEDKIKSFFKYAYGVFEEDKK
jgi:hypothetical protein